MSEEITSNAGTDPAHVEAVLVGSAMVAPAFAVAIVVGPREVVALVGVALYLGLLVGGAAVTGLLDTL